MNDSICQISLFQPLTYAMKKPNTQDSPAMSCISQIQQMQARLRSNREGGVQVASAPSPMKPASLRSATSPSPMKPASLRSATPPSPMKPAHLRSATPPSVKETCSLDLNRVTPEEPVTKRFKKPLRLSTTQVGIGYSAGWKAHLVQE